MQEHGGFPVLEGYEKTIQVIENATNPDEGFKKRLLKAKETIRVTVALWRVLEKLFEQN
jgi:hypothetical protein